jgi:general secretion pathway protein K
MVVALLVVTLVVMVAATVSKDFMVLLRQVENQLHSQQAYAYLLGSEGIGRRTLLEDLKDDRSSDVMDHPGEGWLDTEQEFVTDHGLLQGRLSDLQGRLNLNSLETSAGTVYGVNALRFIRLLQVLDLEQPLAQHEAEAITNSVLDWLDGDDVERPDGAEAYYYGDAEPPGRAANRAMASVSELRMVKGMTAEIYRALRPYVTVWPEVGGQININTASEQVLRSLGADKDHRPLDGAEIQLIVDEREKQQGLVNLDVFNLPGLSGRKINTAELAVASNVFLLTSQTEFQGRLFTLHSVLKRDTTAAEVAVIARSVGEL